MKGDDKMEVEDQNMKTDSWEITKNTKGYTWKVKAYGDNPNETESKMLEHLKKIEVVINNLNMKEVV